MTRRRQATTFVSRREHRCPRIEELESRHLLSIGPAPLIGPVLAPVADSQPLVPARDFGAFPFIEPIPEGDSPAGEGEGSGGGSGQILGTVWEDYNLNGQWDSNEPALAGVTVYLDLDENGQWDEGEPSDVSQEETGQYAITELAAGTYLVAEVVPEGWTQTYPRFGNRVDHSEGSGEEGAAAFELTTTNSAVLVHALGTTDDFGDGEEAGAPVNEAIGLINLDEFWADPRFADYDGTGLATVVIDTGIDRDHPFFGPDNNDDGVADRIVYQYDFVSEEEDASDQNDHGSNVASIIASEDADYPGVAPAAGIIALQVLDASGTGTFGNVEAALQWVVENVETYNIASVNFSLGDSGNYSAPQCLYGIDDEMAALAAMDVIVVSASGNSYYGSQGIGYPSADPNSLSVGAVYQSDCGPQTYGSYCSATTTGPDRITPFSQRHETLTTVMAPGAPITGADSSGGVVTMHGTSQATPYISGLAVLAQQMAIDQIGRRLTVEEFATLLRESAVTIHDGDDEDDSVVNTDLDFPRVDVLSFAEALANIDIPAGCHLVELADAETVDDVDFGNSWNYEPVAVADAYTTYKNIPLEIDGPGVLENDSDLNEDDLSAVWGDGPLHGVVTLDDDGGFLYTADFDFVGQDSFTYLASDGQRESEPITVTIDVQIVPPTGIVGIAWNDVDADGIRDAEEPVVEGATILLDLNGNSEWDPDEPTKTTDENGAYAFYDLPPATYQVVELPREGWEPTDPEPPYCLVATTATAGTGGYWFSLIELEMDPISEAWLGWGCCDNGLDTDPQTGLLYIGGVYLQVFDPDLQFFTQLSGFVSGETTSLQIRSISFAPDGTLHGISSDGGLYTIDKETAESQLIGPVSEQIVAMEFAADGTLYGVLFDSVMSDSTLVTIDPSSGAILSSIGSLELHIADIDCTPDGKLHATVHETYELFELDPTTGQETLVGVFNSDLHDITSPVLLGGGVHTVTIQYGTIYEDIDFGSRRAVPEAVEITPADGQPLAEPPHQILIEFNTEVEPTALGAAGLTIDGAESLAVFMFDPHTIAYALPPLADGSHSATLLAGAVANVDGRPSEPLSIEFFTDTTPPVVAVDTLVTVDSTPSLTGTVDDPEATVDVTVGGQTYGANNLGNGQWELPDNTITPALEPGVYDVQAAAFDWLGNPAADPTLDELTIQSPLVTLEGTTWYDADRNGDYDLGEPALADVTVYLDLDEDGTLDAGEPWTVSDGDGHYLFSDLQPGDYVVAEVFTGVWAQTSPGFSTYGVLRASVGPQHTIADDRSTGSAISADGRFLAYTSSATNLVSDDLNGVDDVFVHDRSGGEVCRVSISALGAEANGASYDAAVSRDGRYIAFTSDASNLVDADNNAASDIFVFDQQTGSLQRASVASGGAEAGGDSFACSISANGRYVAFASDAANLVPDDGNGSTDVFVHDQETGQTRCVSLGTSGAPADGQSTAPAISADGQFVAFESTAADLVSGDANAMRDVFVYDLQENTLELISVNSEGQQANGNSYDASISGDGHYVAFESCASNLSPSDPDVYADVFVFDRQSDSLQWIPPGSGDPGDATKSVFPTISTDGTTVAFLAGTDYGGVFNVVVYDHVTSQAESYQTQILWSLLDGGQRAPALSADGQSVAFESRQSFGDGDDNNLAFDVFVVGDAPALVGPHAVTTGVGETAGGLDFGHYFLLPGDATGDGYVDEQDSAVLASHWGQTVSGAALHGDFNDDGLVDFIDACILAANWHAAIAQDPPDEGAAASGGDASDDSLAATSDSVAPSTTVDAGTTDADARRLVGPKLRRSITRRALSSAKTRDDSANDPLDGLGRSPEAAVDLTWIDQAESLARGKHAMKVRGAQHLAHDRVLAARGI